MRRHDRMRIEVEIQQGRFKGQKTIYNWDLTGLSEEIETIREACRWRDGDEWFTGTHALR